MAATMVRVEGMRWLVLLLVVFPFLELYVLWNIGREIGFFPVLALTLASGVLGSALARREGRRVMGEWRRAIDELRPPEEGVLEAALIIGGALLLILPGVLSDVLGLLCLLPTRRWLVGPLRRAFVRHIENGQLRVMSTGTPGAAPWGAPSSPFGRQDPFGRTTDPFAAAAHARRRSSGGVVDTTGEAVNDAPRELPR